MGPARARARACVCVEGGGGGAKGEGRRKNNKHRPTFSSAYATVAGSIPGPKVVANNLKD